jgi:hypothetical protein
VLAAHALACISCDLLRQTLKDRLGYLGRFQPLQPTWPVDPDFTRPVDEYVRHARLIEPR